MNILTFTTLYPNSRMPRHGVFIENRIRAIKTHYPETNIIVVAPVPWFPFSGRFFGDYAEFTKVPRHEIRYGIEVYHPRYLVIPKIGMSLAPLLMAISVYAFMRSMIKNRGDCIVDAHYAYPDGVTAALLSSCIGFMFTVTSRGTDLHTIPRFEIPRRQIVWSLKKAKAVFCVSENLQRIAEKLTDFEANVITAPNGVDKGIFDLFPDCREPNSGFFSVLSVGNLIPLKGHHLVIKAIAEIDDAKLTIVGEGPYRKTLSKLIRELGLQDRVEILGNKPQECLARLYNQADCTVLMSENEGWPNVVAESLSCGTPVIATNVGAVPEILSSPDCGFILKDRCVRELLGKIASLRRMDIDSPKIARYADTFSWKETAGKHVSLWRDLVGKELTHD